ncbi:MAG: chromosomal replication initiator protein DnaA [Clostridia bacterium]|nr:chromosomal replication initiator protein DnaA [Clostridia bacterium]
MQSYEFIWESILANMKGTYSEVRIKAFFKDIKIIDIESQYILLMTPTTETLDFVRGEQAVLERYVNDALGEFKVVYIYAYDRDMPNIDKIREAIKNDLENPEQGKMPYDLTDDLDKQKPGISNSIMPQKKAYTFDNYVVGNSNLFVYNACLAVAENPSSMWNPLLIYGPTGLGKTHLMYATTRKISELYPEKKIIYITGEQFVNDMVDHLRKKDTKTGSGFAAFREKYRSCDVLLIDDIQFIAGKNNVQEEFFHTFNTLYESQKQIIITSDRPLREIKLLDERLQYRFEMGLTADIQPPDYELRAAIIKNKAEALHLDLSESSVIYLAEHLTKNIRQIEGALTKIYAKKCLYGFAVTDELVIESISDLTTVNVSPKDIVEKVFTVVSNKYGTSKEEMCSKTKKREVAEPRHVCAYLISELTDYSQRQIGTFLGRDRTTIINSIEVIKKMIMNDPSFEKEIKDIISEIKD